MKHTCLPALLIFSCAFLAAQPAQKPHGSKHVFNPTDSSYTAQHFHQGKPFGNWVTTYRDSSRMISLHADYNRIEDIRLSALNDTVFRIEYIRTAPSGTRPFKQYLYENNKVTRRSILDMKGRDSIIERREPDGSFKIIAFYLNGRMMHTAEGAPVFNEPSEVLPQKDSIYTYTDNSPSFAGGSEKLQEFIGDNIRYPQEAKEAGIEGQVVVTFIVEPSGAISGIRVQKSSGSALLDQEALRVIRKTDGMWKPGKANGKPVRTIYRLPISFSLEN